MPRIALMAAVVVVACLAAGLVSEVAAKKWTVGNNKFWNPNVNYTVWAQDKHFYFDDWLCNYSLSLSLSLSTLILITF